MGVSIDYSAKRAAAITEQEQATIDPIVQRQNAGFPYEAELLEFYKPDHDADEEPGYDLNLWGATKLPAEPEQVVPTIRYWFAALTELRRALPDANWSVSIEDTEADWDDVNGYSLEGLDEAEYDEDEF